MASSQIFKSSLTKLYRVTIRSKVTVTTPSNSSGVGIISLNSIPVNSLSRDMFVDITEGIKLLEDDSSCHAAILTSSCKVFSSGDIVFRIPSFFNKIN